MKQKEILATIWHQRQAYDTLSLVGEAPEKQ